MVRYAYTVICKSMRWIGISRSINKGVFKRCERIATATTSTDKQKCDFFAHIIRDAINDLEKGNVVYLFNIVEDPTELNNIKKEFPEVAQKMETTLRNWRKNIKE